MKISLGTVQFGMDYGVNSINGQINKSESVEIINYAHNHGISLLDTAPSYGNSEKILGDMNTEYFDIVTKTRNFRQDRISEKEIDLLIIDLNKSLRLLNRESIYGLLVHNADDLLKIGSDKIFKQLELFKKEGKVSRIGVSVYTSDQLQEIINRFDIDLVQMPFNILDRRMIDSGVLTKVYNKNIEVHSRSVFLQGLLLMNRKIRPKKFDRWKIQWKLWHEWLTDNHLTALEASLKYAISIPEISKILVGVDSKDQLREIIKSTHGNLPSIPKELFMHDADLLNPSNWGNL
jgi:aryl-alcohol dehydrogenase-like predicted oxidoreductase